MGGVMNFDCTTMQMYNLVYFENVIKSKIIN